MRTVEQVGGISQDDLKISISVFSRLERFWTDNIRYRL
jgi:hypothetical protein